MENNCKRLILDKSIFVGTSEQKLCQFAKNHFLILPEVLIYECATAPDRKKGPLLQRFTNIVRAGGYVCPSVGLMVEKETQQGYQYGNIEDISKTQIIRTASEIQWAEERSQKAKENEMKHTEKCRELAIKIAERREVVNQLEPLKKYVKEARKISQRNKQYLLQNYLQAIDICLSVRDACIGKTKERPEAWISWHYDRLTCLYLLLFGERKDSALEKLEHHLQDMAYIILLCRADGLLTEDEELELLAKVAFPKKDIFADLGKVPEEYICDWRQR